MNFDKIADYFYHSFYRHEWIGNSEEVLQLSKEDAYKVQNIVSQKRLANGESLAGYKVGCTSPAIRKQFGIEDPIVGGLFYPYVVNEGEKFDCSNFLHCAIEPEMIICIGKDLDKENPTDQELIDAIKYVSPGIEIHEYTFWVDPPCIQELICSGGIHRGLIVGQSKVSPEILNFGDESFSIHLDDQFVGSEKADKIMGGPLKSLRWLTNHLLARGDRLQKGDLVIPGSPLELISVEPGMRMRVTIDGVGAVEATLDTDNA